MVTTMQNKIQFGNNFSLLERISKEKKKKQTKKYSSMLEKRKKRRNIIDMNQNDTI